VRVALCARVSVRACASARVCVVCVLCVCVCVHARLSCVCACVCARARVCIFASAGRPQRLRTGLPARARRRRPRRRTPSLPRPARARPPPPQGVASPLAGQMFFRASLFAAFGASKRWLATGADGKPRPLAAADYYKAGAMTGFVAAFTEGPIDFYKSQIQASGVLGAGAARPGRRRGAAGARAGASGGACGGPAAELHPRCALARVAWWVPSTSTPDPAPPRPLAAAPLPFPPTNRRSRSSAPGRTPPTSRPTLRSAPACARRCSRTASGGPSRRARARVLYRETQCALEGRWLDAGTAGPRGAPCRGHRAEVHEPQAHVHAP
jgi:hypothetical protein